MFFGLELKSSSPISLQLEKTLKISQAVLVPPKNGLKEPIQVIAEYENKKFILCILGQSAAWQCPLDVLFAPGSDVKLSIKGPGIVHLTGYEVDEDLGMSDLDMSDSSSEDEETNNTSKANDVDESSEVESSDDKPSKQIKQKVTRTKTIANGSNKKVEIQKLHCPTEDSDESEDEDYIIDADEDDDDDDLAISSDEEDEDLEVMSSEDAASDEDMSDEELGE